MLHYINHKNQHNDSNLCYNVPVMQLKTINLKNKPETDFASSNPKRHDEFRLLCMGLRV